MRLLLDAKSKNNITYTPDWLKVTYVNAKGESVEVTLDIQGTIDYHKGGLDCRVKGDFILWKIYCNETGEDIDCYENDTEYLSDEEIFEIIKTGKDHRIGLYPEHIESKPMSEYESDILTDCSAFLLYSDNEPEVKFAFETELNVWD